MACPVCREPLTYDLRQLLSAPAPQLPQVNWTLPPRQKWRCGTLTGVVLFQLDEASVSSDFQQRWRELQKILDKQRAKGGLIDPEEESARFLIRIQQVRTAGSRFLKGQSGHFNMGLCGELSEEEAGVISTPRCSVW